MKKTLMFIFLFAFLLSVNVYATDADDYGTFFAEEKEKLMSEIPEENAGILKDIYEDGVISGSPDEIIKKLFSEMLAGAQAPFGAFLSIISVSIIASLAEGLKSSSLKPPSEIFEYISTLIISVTVVIPIVNLISSVSTAISEASGFMKLFIPIFAGIMLAGGETVTADGYQLIALSASELVTVIAENLILPVLSVFLAFSVMASANRAGFDLSKIAKSLKGIITAVLTIITTIYCGLLSAQGIIGSAADTYATKTAKFVISSSVPAIGNALSDALTSVQSGIKTVRSTVGIIGIIAPILIILPSVLNIFSWQICIKSGEIISGMFRREKAEKLLSCVSSAIGLLISVSLLLAALLIVTVTIIIMIGGNKLG